MKRLEVTLAIILSSLVLFGQDDTPKDGFVQYFYPNDQVSSEGTMKDGKPDGYWTTYYVTGIKKSEGKRSNFLLDSIWTFYNNEGDTMQTISYMIGKKNGYHIVYSYENRKEGRDYGEIISKELYVNDKREGMSYYFYTDGKLKSEVSYVNGKRQGLTKEYNQDGVIQSLIYLHNGYITDREQINRYDRKGIKQGVWKEFYGDGKLKNERIYKDGRLNGLYKEFNDNGNLILVLKYVDDQLIAEDIEEDEGVEIRNEYDDQNILVKSGAYKQNIPIGIHRSYNPAGEVIASTIYNDYGEVVSEGIVDNEGKRRGLWKDFFATGELKAEGQYDNNFRMGNWKFFNKNAQVEQTGDYSRGRVHGLWRWYYEDGSLLREEQFYNGKEDGYLIEYSKEGRILTQGDFIEGEPEGSWYYRVGDHTEVGDFVTGLRDGKWRYFYADSTLKFEGYYIQGNPDGKHKLYYNDGALKEERYYVMGIKEKNWKKYDQEGKLVMTITFKDDAETRINGVKVNLPEATRKLVE
jgi:antitoxin component YwqK of YwqJK toxin-antitoxin module